MPSTFTTAPEEVQPLSILLNWEAVFSIAPQPTIMDPCAGYGCILNALAAEVPLVAERARLVSNDANASMPTDLHFDMFSEEQWSTAPDAVHILMGSPPFHLADLALADWVNRAGLFSALHVPGDWVQSGPAYRRAYWAWLQHEGRVAELRGLPRVPYRGTRRCSWLVVFASKELKDLLWQAANECFTWFY